MSTAFKLVIVCLAAFVFGFSAIMTNVLAIYNVGQILAGGWTLANFGGLVILIPAAFCMDVILWYIATELSSAYGLDLNSRPRHRAFV